LNNQKQSTFLGRDIINKLIFSKNGL